MQRIPGVGQYDLLDTIGRYWVQGSTMHPQLDPNDGQHGVTVFINLRTGERREVRRRPGCDTVPSAWRLYAMRWPKPARR